MILNLAFNSEKSIFEKYALIVAKRYIKFGQISKNLRGGRIFQRK
jgi:hypothetical protein